jgi:hypothetical protein
MIVSCCVSLSSFTFPLHPSMNYVITFWHRCRGTVIHFSSKMTLFGKPLLNNIYPTILPGDSTKDDSLISLIISRKLYVDSTDDKDNYDFSMGSRKLQAFRHE